MIYRRILTDEAREDLIAMYCYFSVFWRHALREDVFCWSECSPVECIRGVSFLIGDSSLRENVRKKDMLAVISKVLDEHDAAVERIRGEWVQELWDDVQNNDIIQVWEGLVLEVGKKRFLARIKDLTAARNADEEALFNTKDVPAPDRDLIKPGAEFQRIVYRGGCSLLRFDRLHRWTKAELSAARRRAKKWKEGEE